ncbi:hypothetical protein WQQ_37740 [Hydrocarboniphaga effusa AP103]|uniref:Uncharacterized protein n=1 Tax=Hydrocarboniphaga effusa AP103 TaxID=1172194 RepID=I7Z9S1_9GAMM|nr:hypothetical protein WQQ_37740 [Hydrocarboniphaga effusa AP103]
MNSIRWPQKRKDRLAPVFSREASNSKLQLRAAQRPAQAA